MTAKVVDAFRERLFAIGSFDEMPDLLCSEECHEALGAYRESWSRVGRYAETRLTSFRFGEAPRFKKIFNSHHAPFGKKPNFRNPVEMPGWRAQAVYQYQGDWFLLLAFWNAIGVCTASGSPEWHALEFWAEDFAKIAVVQALRGEIHFRS